MKAKNNFLHLRLATWIFSGAIVLLGGRAIAENAVLRSMFSCQAQGLGGLVPTIKVWYEQGTNLSFIPAGEKIRKVWLNDPSQVTLDFDGPMCVQFGQEGGNSEDCKNSAANVIQLRRIPKISLPGVRSTDNTLLTVITEGQSQSKLYTFKVLYADTAPEYHTLAIFADPGGVASCARNPS